jgi:hypothetical protein
MKLFLFQINEIPNFGVRLICLDIDGKVHIFDKRYTPYFFAANMPVSYQRDIKCKVDVSHQTKPYIGYTEKPWHVVKLRTHKRKFITWKNIHEMKAPMTRQYCEERKLCPSGWFDHETRIAIAE